MVGISQTFSPTTQLGEISLLHVVIVSHSHLPELGHHFSTWGITWLMSIHLLDNRPHEGNTMTCF